MQKGQHTKLAPEDIWDLNAGDKINRIGLDFQQAWAANVTGTVIKGTVTKGMVTKGHPLLLTLKQTAYGALFSNISYFVPHLCLYEVAVIHRCVLL